jgi:citrate lyase subunit beta/citryl-CoA lyase
VNRSYLFVPGKKNNVVEKAVSSDADFVIIDLEDAVAISEKENAREIVKEALLNFKEKKPIYIRINDISTPFWEEDVKYAATYGAHGIVVPKAESREGIQKVCRSLRSYFLLNGDKERVADFKVIPLIETAKGVQFVYDIAGADPFIERLAFGYIDYSLDINCELTPGGIELLYTRSQIVVASRAAEIDAPIDAVYPNIKNPEGLEAETRHAKQLGFRAKLIIHPKQIDVVHNVFSPTEQEIEEAKAIVEQFEKAEKEGIASISVNDSLVDYPVYKKAKDVLKQLQSI